MSFAQDLAKIAERTNQRLGEVVRQTTINIFSGIVQASPVDTGLFKGNWQLSIGSAADGTLKRLDPSGATVQAEIEAGVPGQLGQVVFLSNNLPYAYRLEYEQWSPQARKGMVRVNVARFEREIANQARSLGP